MDDAAKYMYGNSGLQHWVFVHSLNFLYRNSLAAVPFAILAVLVLTGLLYSQVAIVPLSLWFIGGFLVAAIRFGLWFGYYNFRSRYTLKFWLNSYRVMSLMSGVVTGLSTWLFFDQADYSSRLVILLFILGLTSGSLAAHGVDKITFLSFAYTACGISALKLMLTGEPTLLTLGALHVLYLLVMTRTGIQNSHIFQENFELTYSMRYRATHDSLVELLNRDEFEVQFEQRTPMAKGGVAMLFIDLDNFKSLNDTLGHQAGDEALKQVADIIRYSIRGDDVAARLGGDEFVILIYPKNLNIAKNIALRILHEVENIDFGNTPEYSGLGTSIGIAYHPNNDIQLSQLMRVADMACYQSKERGKNQITLLHTDEDHIKA